MATPSRRTALAPSAFGRGGGGGRGGRSGSAVGEPGQGAAILEPDAARPRRRGAAPPAARAGRGTRAATPRASRPIPFGGVDPIYVVGSDGLLHALLSSNGADAEPPVPFLPPSAKPSALMFVDGVVYTSTSDGCGAAPNGVWAIDLTATAATGRSCRWKTGGPNVAGATGPAFGTDGTLYVALGKAPARSRARPPCRESAGAVRELGRRARSHDARSRRTGSRRTAPTSTRRRW